MSFSHHGTVYILPLKCTSIGLACQIPLFIILLVRSSSATIKTNTGVTMHLNWGWDRILEYSKECPGKIFDLRKINHRGNTLTVCV